jgi:hypothetical protein
MFVIATVCAHLARELHRLDRVARLARLGDPITSVLASSTGLR